MAKKDPKNSGSKRDERNNPPRNHNPETGRWTKRDSATGRFMDRKASDVPFRGIRKEGGRSQPKNKTNNTGPKAPPKK